MRNLSDYQRFVSYIYEYQGSKKSKNCGFARVEVRNRQCRLEIHMKLPVYPFTPSFQVFAFVPDGAQMTGLSLGKANYHQGAVYGLYTIPERNINGLTYGMKDLGGLYIRSDSGQFFATAWKEINIKPELFINSEDLSADISSEHQQPVREPEIPAPSPESPNDAPQVHAASLEANEPEENESNENGSGENDSGEDDSIISPDRSIPYNVSYNPPVSDSADFYTPDNTNAHVSYVPEMSREAYPETDRKIYPETTRKTVPEATQKTFPDTTQKTHPESTEKTASEAPSDTTNPPAGSWEEIQSSYPHMQPFFDDDIHQCVKLSLKDIPQLNRSGIPIGMNQFLIHGCQSYQHFLLGRTADSEDGEYVLAVPGIYDEKEQILASMFGFPNFKPAKNNTIRPGQFGYWYRLLY